MTPYQLPWVSVINAKVIDPQADIRSHGFQPAVEGPGAAALASQVALLWLLR